MPRALKKKDDIKKKKSASQGHLPSSSSRPSSSSSYTYLFFFFHFSDFYFCLFFSRQKKKCRDLPIPLEGAWADRTSDCQGSRNRQLIRELRGKPLQIQPLPGHPRLLKRLKPPPPQSPGGSLRQAAEVLVERDQRAP